ncbi:MAG: hypothetical protein RI955_776 [Bacteroidota bacterium]
MLKFLLELFVLYLVYKLIVDIILPIASATRKTKKMMDEMNQQQQPFQNNTTSNSSATKKSSHNDEYIDYEEVK